MPRSFASPGNFRLAGLAILAALRYERAFLATTLVATAVTLGATFALRRNPRLPILRRVLWALGHAVLPFMAGWTAAGASLGGSTKPSSSECVISSAPTNRVETPQEVVQA